MNSVNTTLLDKRKEEAWADDKAYIAEMDKRSKELEIGKVKGLQLEDLVTRARQ